MSSGSGQPDIESLRLAREESRATLDHQIQLLNDLDDKALRTTRMSIVLIALIISIGQLLPQEQIDTMHALTKFAVGVSGLFLAGVVFIGIGIYSVSTPAFGVGESHRTEVREGAYSEREWLNLLLDEYDEWTEEMRELNNDNATWLSRAQNALAVAVSYLFFAGVGFLTPISAPTVFLGAILLGTIALLARVLWTIVISDD